MVVVGMGVTVLLACSAPTEVALPVDAVPFTPPAWYRSVYASLEACSGLTGDFARVQWFRMRGTQVPEGDGGDYAAALTYPSTHRIIIADFYAADTIVVKHELMHELSRTPAHPSRWFDGRCGDLMP
jgi:hypothetical protein